MQMSNVPEQAQQQKMVLSPGVIQSLEILQMPVLDLQRNIENELEENPFLEMQPKEEFQGSRDASNKKDNYEYNISFKYMEESQYDNYLKSYSENDKKTNPIDLIIKRKTLKEYLLEQSGTLKESSLIVGICNYIIENIDERGYLNCEVKEIAVDLKVSEKLVRRALKIVQSFHPSGIGARDLKECLKIQVLQKHIRDENVYKIIDNYLELIAENRPKEIAKGLGVDIHKTQEYLSIIKSLEPKPSRGFYTGGFENFVIPEAYIKKIGTELYIITNSGALPQLTLNNDYVELMKQKADATAAEFFKERYDRALFLIRGIEDRNKTIHSILEKLVDVQKEYFLYGEEFLKPMTAGDIAADLQIHESTVSRAIKDKYISTPHSTVRIKDMFSAGIKTKLSNETVSSNVIKNQIKNLIDKENKTSPLSDQDICDILRNNNFEISRRTVAKYREELGIGSSSRRKEFQ